MTGFRGRTFVAAAGAATLPFLAAAADLVAFTVAADKEIREPLTGRPGDAQEGRRIAADRALGNCLACHAIPGVDDPPGDLGPDLKGVGARLKAAEIRLRVVDAKIANPETAMPAYYRVDGLYGVRRDLVGKPILTAEQIEDVVAFLATLKD
jgi:sulfur-oxidizing protein SoxX